MDKAISVHNLELCVSYLDQFNQRDRLLTLLEEGEPVALCGYFLFDDEGEALEKSKQVGSLVWPYLPLDTETGVICCIQILVVRERWTKRLREALSTYLLTKHPTIEQVCYLRDRARGDQWLSYPARRGHEVPNTSTQ